MNMEELYGLYIILIVTMLFSLLDIWQSQAKVITELRHG